MGYNVGIRDSPADDLLAGHLLAQHLQRLPAPRGMRLGAVCQDGAGRHRVHPARRMESRAYVNMPYTLIKTEMPCVVIYLGQSVSVKQC